MMKKLLVLTLAAVLTAGAATIAYAKGKDDKTAYRQTKTYAYEYKNNNVQNINFSNIRSNSMRDIMIKVMEENGYKELAGETRKGNYKAIDEFMKNLTDKDFQKMIQIMKDNGYEGMANMMENIGKEGMIQMYSAMGGSAACSGAGNSNFGGMMGGNFGIQ